MTKILCTCLLKTIMSLVSVSHVEICVNIRKIKLLFRKNTAIYSISHIMPRPCLMNAFQKFRHVSPDKFKK